MFVYEDDSVCLQSQSPRDVCPQSLHSLPPGDSEFHRATGGGDDGQAHGGLTGGDLGPAGCRPTRENAAEPRRLVHSGDRVRFWALRLLSLAAVGRCNAQPVRKTTSTLPSERPAPLEHQANHRRPDEPSAWSDQPQRSVPHLVSRHAPFTDDAICIGL